MNVLLENRAILSFQVDPLGAVIFLDDNNTIYKLDPDSQEQLSFPSQFGFTIDGFSVNNPHKIALFSADQQKIIILDNQLQAIMELDLEEMDLWNVSALAMSFEDKLWLVDPDNRQLLEIDVVTRELVSTVPLRMIKTSIQESNIEIKESKIYLTSPEGIHVFSIVGEHLSSLSNELGYFIGEDGKMYYLSDEFLLRYEDKLPEDELLIKLSSTSDKIKMPLLTKEAFYYLEDDLLFKIEF